MKTKLHRNTTCEVQYAANENQTNAYFVLLCSTAAHSVRKSSVLVTVNTQIFFLNVSNELCCKFVKEEEKTFYPLIVLELFQR